MKIALTNRKKKVVGHAVIDPADLVLVKNQRWHLDGKGYARTSFLDRDVGKVRHLQMHRVILGLTDPKLHTDHRDRDRLNNRRSNLRVVTIGQNNQNRASYAGSGSRFRGVHWREDVGYWIASGSIKGKTHHIGRSKDEEEAGRMAREWRKENYRFSEDDDDE